MSERSVEETGETLDLGAIRRRIESEAAPSPSGIGWLLEAWNDRDALLAEIDRLRAALPVWRPIETVQSGWFIGWNGYEVAMLTLHDDGRSFVYVDDGERIVPKPTHWMPLPTPPATPAEETK